MFKMQWLLSRMFVQLIETGDETMVITAFQYWSAAGIQFSKSKCSWHMKNLNAVARHTKTIICPILAQIQIVINIFLSKGCIKSEYHSKNLKTLSKTHTSVLKMLHFPISSSNGADHYYFDKIVW